MILRTVTACMVLLAFSAAPAFGGELEDLKDEVRALRDMVKTLEDRLDREARERETLCRKSAEMEKKLADGEERITHLDKHITHMAEHGPALTDGLSIAGGITTVVQGTVGADKNIGEDPLDGSFSVDLEVSKSVFDSGELFLLIEAAGGDGITNELGTLLGVNADAGDSGSSLSVTEAWYEHRFLGDTVAFTFGKLDLTNYFDGNEVANDETVQFMADGFVNNAAVEFPGNGPGVRIGCSPSDMLELGVGVQAADSDWEDIGDGLFVIAEAGLKPEVAGRPGNYRVYGWTNGADHTSFSNPALTDKEGWGVGASLDQHVTEDVTLFSRAGYRDGDVYSFDLAWSAGAGVSGGVWGRPGDVFGIAWGMAHLSGAFRSSAMAPVSPADEGRLETYYKIFLNEHIEVTPDVQLITNAMGDRSFGEAVAVGVRAQVTF